MANFSVAPYYAILLFIAILVTLECGCRLGERDLRLDPESAQKGIGALEGAVYGLLGLLMAFTFSGASERMNVRRTLIVQETNAIGTAWLRVDLLPADNQLILRPMFRDYVDARINFYKNIYNEPLAQQESAKSTALQQLIWSTTVLALKSMPSQPAGISALQSLNDMIDITTSRQVALQTHPPRIIYQFLCFLILVSSMFIGYGMAGGKQRHWLHSVCYALVMVTALYVIIDFEFPRLGMIRIDNVDQVMLQQRQAME
ncbi:MAG: hypothetical protein H9917_13205 [Candidatus Oceanisphaera merdipullorum]|nr:hypothetical protein [Candidatus Oceanisphaera merdipullorum]